jgi:hypothetical protein
MPADPTSMSAVRVLALLFLASIFLGDVWLVKLTLPVGVLLIPLIVAARRPRTSLPPAVYLLCALLLVVAMQIISGRSLNWRADLSVWMPLVFALLTIVSLSGVTLPARDINRAMLAGGAVTGAIMIGMVAFAPGNLYLVPGQNSYETGSNFKEAAVAAAKRAAGVDIRPDARIAESEPRRDGDTPGAPDSPVISGGDGRDAATAMREKGAEAQSVHRAAPDLQVVERRMDEDTQLFYSIKNRAKSFLGQSNYIAVFFVFLFAVTLFNRNYLAAAAMAGLVLVTLSRLGSGSCVG